MSDFIEVLSGIGVTQLAEEGIESLSSHLRAPTRVESFDCIETNSRRVVWYE